MTPLQAGILVLAAAVAGALNSVAGGGSFLSFPALMFTGVPPIPANATNTVALWPGSVASAGAYRKELAAQRHELISLGLTSLIGGILGAVLLLRTPQSTFLTLLPFLLLAATLLFAFGGAITGHVRRRIGDRKGPAWLTTLGSALLQLLIATYGGYFGGGIGILMLALLSLMGMENMHAMNALKTVLASLINGVAVITFIAARAVYWPQGMLMTIGGILGGYFGAYFARKIDPKYVRRFVIVVGFAMTIVFFVRR